MARALSVTADELHGGDRGVLSMVDDMSAAEKKDGFSERCPPDHLVCRCRACGWGWGSIDSESRLDVEAEAKNALDKDSLRVRLAEAGALQVLTDLLSRTNDVDVVEHVAASLRTDPTRAQSHSWLQSHARRHCSLALCISGRASSKKSCSTTTRQQRLQLQMPKPIPGSSLRPASRIWRSPQRRRLSSHWWRPAALRAALSRTRALCALRLRPHSS